jgi:hypothetical protein
MSNLVGWMVTFNGAAKGASYVGGRLYSSAAFPPLTKIEQSVLVYPLLHVRFAPNGGWIVICEQNYWWYGNTPPADLISAIQAGIQGGLILSDVFFTPNNDWILKWNNTNGSRVYKQSTYFPNDIVTIITELDNNGSGSQLLCLVFPPPANAPSPSPTGLSSQNNIWTSCIVICENNKWQALGNPPSDITTKITGLISENYVIRSVVYSSGTGWLITMTNNAYWANGGFDSWLFQQIGQAVATFGKDGLTLADVVIEVPLRTYMLQITEIACQTTRAGPLNYQDTLYGAASITVTNNDTITSASPSPVSTVNYFGNWIRTNETLGLNGSSNSNPNAGILSDLPAGPPPQYAMAIGPIQIMDPRASVSFSFALLNQGSGGPGELSSALQTIAKAGASLAQGAITALFSYIGTPALGSITGKILTQISNLAFSNCDGLVAVETINTTGATLTGLTYTQLAAEQAQSGSIFTTTTTYNNTTFPDNEFAPSKSPYNSPSSFCQASSYAVTYSILESDVENTPNTTEPVATGKSKILSLTLNWPGGQLLNGVDTTPRALTAFEFWNRIYLFWNANDSSTAIYCSVSKDGRTWPNGTSLGSMATLFPVTACVFENQSSQNQLYVFWTDAKTSKIYFSISTDGITWPQTWAINDTDTTSNSPAACVYSGQELQGPPRLFLFWKANDPSNKIYFSSYAGNTGQVGQPIGNNTTYPFAGGIPINATDSTSAAPVACVFQGLLYLFWKANDSSNRIFFTYGENNGANLGFPMGNPINKIDSTSDGPLAACVFEDQLFLFWKANDSSNRIYFSSSWGGQTWPAGVPINSTDSTPKALAAYSFQNQISLFWTANDSSHKIYTSSSRSPVLMATTP